MSTFISVILTAHNPTKHLLEALDSIHAQDLHYNLFEVLVIRDFEDEAFVRKISEYGFRDVLVDEDSFKGKVEVGLWESNGKVLTFMEDDDLWKTNRLSTIFSIFRDDNELVFYHNSHVPIDQKGNVLGRSMFYNIPTPHLVKPGPNYREEVNKVSKYNPDFNTSSMAVRKDHLISAENDFKQVVN